MDCGSCVKKIEGALSILPGVAEIQVSMMAESLTVHFVSDQTDPDAVEKAVRKLGFTPSRMDKELPEKTEEAAWYQSNKGRLVVISGALLLAAWGVSASMAAPYGQWAFAGACLLGLVPIAKKAFAALRAGMPFTIEMLMTIAACGALVIGEAAEAALVVFLFAIGELLEGVAANRARAGIRALGDLVPKTAMLLIDGKLSEVPASSLAIGQSILVRPGDRIAADGMVAYGISAVDESPVTGESVPVTKVAGDQVFAGSINVEAALTVTVAKAAADNTIARIIRMVEEAEAAQAPTERFIDRFSRYYMPIIVGMAILVALVPPLGFGGAWETWTYRALALLLIGCPCALVISVPASIASALSAGTKRGLLMKGGSVIEAAAETRLVAFDKTGTLTAGEPRVTDILPKAANVTECLALAAAVESGSSHPLARAILDRAAEGGVSPLSANDIRVIPGRGLEALVEGIKVFVGSPRQMAEDGLLASTVETEIMALEEQGKTVAVITRDGQLCGLVALRDEPRDDAAETISDLKSMGIQSVMLTGDNARTAAAIAGGLGLEYRAELLPDDKVAAIREFSMDRPVMMVGDGINDAPALALANVGVAMGGGTDVALETADAALLSNRVSDVVAKIRLSRAAMGNIRQNIVLALGLKAIFLVTSVLGVTGLWLAIMADTGATVLVTLNALRLLGYRPER
nr:heavy metal translocating P-type ATPase [Aestuariispira insulae]